MSSRRRASRIARSDNAGRSFPPETAPELFSSRWIYCTLIAPTDGASRETPTRTTEKLTERSVRDLHEMHEIPLLEIKALKLRRVVL